MNYSKKPLNYGYANQTLSIDLGTGKISILPLDARVRDYFIGGRGLGLYLLHNKINGKTNAFDEENPLIFSPGPLGGIPQFPGTSKCMAVSLSPLTGIAGISNFGGHFGAYLKYAGFDALEICCIAAKDTMIVINGLREEISLLDAPADDQVFNLQDFIVNYFLAEGYEKKNISFLTTGIGAVNTRFGCINSHYYDATKPVEGGKGIFRAKQAGRTGIGTVMAQKNIRAIVVLADFPRGDNPYGAADWEKVKQAGLKLHGVVKEVDPQALKMHRKGSAGLIAFMNKDEYQSLPVKNYQLGSDPQADRICGKYYAEHLFEHRGMDGCFPGCNLRCTKGGWVTLASGEHQGRKVWVDGPEYETAAGFGSNLGIWNPEFIMEANWYCDNYGMDTITTAVIMAFLMECYQRGYLTKKETDGFALSWGDEQNSLQFIHDLAYKKTELAGIAGLGMTQLIAWVAARYTQRTGNNHVDAELRQFAMQSKGLPFSLYRTHRSLSMQASYAAASDIGAHHAAAWLIKADLLGAFPSFQDKARALITYPRVRLGNDNMGLCKLPWVDVFNPASQEGRNGDVYINPASQEIYAQFYNGMLGTNLAWEQIFAQTDRDINLQRVMNIMVFEEKTAEQDWIPDRAIGPTDDALYEAEKEFNDRQLSAMMSKTLTDIEKLSTAEKRELLFAHRRGELKKLIGEYYAQRGWTANGIPKIDTLRKIGLWDFLNEQAKATISKMSGY